MVKRTMIAQTPEGRKELMAGLKKGGYTNIRYKTYTPGDGSGYSPPVYIISYQTKRGKK